MAAFMAEVAVISWRNLHNAKQLPPPSEYAGAAIVWGLLGLMPASAATATSAFAWALVGASFINLWNPNTPFNLLHPANNAPEQASASTPGQ